MSATDTTTPLDSFEGMPVLAVGIELPRAAGGLQDALAVDPDTWHVGDDVTIILRGPCQKVRYEAITGGLRRVHVFGVEKATVVDHDFANGVLDAQAARIAEAKKGPLDEELLAQEREALAAEHAEGDYEVPEANCPTCHPEPES